MPRNKIIKSREIGAAVKNRRKELGYSQEWLAEFLGVSYQQVQRYENGISMINVETIQKIASALSVPVAYFITPDATLISAEPPAFPSYPEEKALLEYFRGITVKSDRQLVVNVARLAAKK